jgi:hypothetical protein
MVLVDMVADRHLNILRESNSTPWLDDLVFNSARRLGYAGWFSGGTFPVEDDHLPFLSRSGIDIVDLAHFRSYHHTAQDTVDRYSPLSLAVTGRVVLAPPAYLKRVG